MLLKFCRQIGESSILGNFKRAFMDTVLDVQRILIPLVQDESRFGVTS